MSRTWKLREGKVLVVEDASTASLVIVVRDLNDQGDKIVLLEEVLRRLRLEPQAAAPGPAAP